MKNYIEYEKISKFITFKDLIDIGMPIDYNDTVLNFIEKYKGKLSKINHVILRLVLSEDYLSEKDLRLFAVWCARQVEHLMNDKEAIAALNVSEKYGYGLATDQELRNTREKSPILDPINFFETANLAAWHSTCDDAIDAAKDASETAAKAAAKAASTAATRTAANVYVVSSVHTAIYDYYKNYQLDKLTEIFRHYEQKEYNWKNL